MFSSELDSADRRLGRRAFRFLLGEAFLGFLAIVAAALTLFPMLFEVGVRTAAIIEFGQWAIIAWFGIEYVVALATAPSKRLFLRDPWRWIDLATILIPLASLLPSVSDLLRSSPILRLIRLARLITLGVRASGIVVRAHHRQSLSTAARGPIHVARRTADAAEVAVSRDDLVRWLEQRKPGWFHATNPDESDLHAIEVAAELPAGFLTTQFIAASHPRVAAGADYLAVFAWTPGLSPATTLFERSGVLVLAWPDRVVTLARDLRAAAVVRSATTLPNFGADVPLPIAVLTGTLEGIVRENEVMVASYEQELRALEDLPVRESRPVFFEHTFRLKKQLSTAQWDLWRLKAVLSELGQGQSVHVIPAAATSAFSRLAATADYLYETVVNTREDVMAVIELHLNVVSFDMNRVMRVLAVVSVLGLIPAVIGGLFGMNLMDNPWHFTLPQVTFVIGFGMLLTLYFFFVKGWLK